MGDVLEAELVNILLVVDMGEGMSAAVCLKSVKHGYLPSIIDTHQGARRSQNGSLERAFLVVDNDRVPQDFGNFFITLAADTPVHSETVKLYIRFLEVVENYLGHDLLCFTPKMSKESGKLIGMLALLLCCGV